MADNEDQKAEGDARAAEEREMKRLQAERDAKEQEAARAAEKDAKAARKRENDTARRNARRASSQGQNRGDDEGVDAFASAPASKRSMFDGMTVLAPADVRRQAMIEASEDAAENPRDFAPDGGRFVVGGVLVDTDGRPVEGKSNVRALIAEHERNIEQLREQLARQEARDIERGAPPADRMFMPEDSTISSTARGGASTF